MSSSYKPGESSIATSEKAEIEWRRKEEERAKKKESKKKQVAKPSLKKSQILSPEELKKLKIDTDDSLQDQKTSKTHNSRCIQDAQSSGAQRPRSITQIQHQRRQDQSR